MEKLGLRLKTVGFAVQGLIKEEELPKILRDLIKSIQMTPVGEPFVVKFPNKESDPSIVGDIIAQPLTAAQPLVFQTLSESYGFFLPAIIPIDTWPEFFDYKGAMYLMIASCRDFDDLEIEETIKSFGFNILGRAHMKLDFGGDC